MKDFITSQEASEKWGVSIRQVQMLCKNGKVEGVLRAGRNQIMPAYAEKPTATKIRGKGMK